jgi:hypothetical protein
MSMHFKPQKLDIILKRINHHLPSVSTIRYRQAEVLAKVLLSIDILNLKTLEFKLVLKALNGKNEKSFELSRFFHMLRV